MRISFFDNVHAGKAVTGDNACGVLGEHFSAEACVLDRFVSGGDEELREAGHAAGFLRVDAVFFGLKILDFCRNFHRAVCSIEQCDRTDAALASLDGVPKFGGGFTYGGHRTHTSNYNSSSIHKNLQCHSRLRAGISIFEPFFSKIVFLEW